MGLTMVQRQAVTKAIATRYKRADRAGKKVILDELCATAGWHRYHARKALRVALTPRWCVRGLQAFIATGITNAKTEGLNRLINKSNAPPAASVTGAAVVSNLCAWAVTLLCVDT